MEKFEEKQSEMVEIQSNDEWMHQDIAPRRKSNKCKLVMIAGGSILALTLLVMSAFIFFGNGKEMYADPDASVKKENSGSSFRPTFVPAYKLAPASATVFPKANPQSIPESQPEPEKPNTLLDSHQRFDDYTDMSFGDNWNAKVNLCISKYNELLEADETTEKPEWFAYVRDTLDGCEGGQSARSFLSFLKRQVVSSEIWKAGTPKCALELFHSQTPKSMKESASTGNAILFHLQPMALERRLWELLHYTLMLGYVPRYDSKRIGIMFALRWFAPKELRDEMIEMARGLGLPSGSDGYASLMPPLPEKGKKDPMYPLVERVLKNPSLLRGIQLPGKHWQAVLNGLGWFTLRDSTKARKWDPSAIFFVSAPGMDDDTVEEWMAIGKQVKSDKDFQDRITRMVLMVFLDKQLSLEQLNNAAKVIMRFTTRDVSLVYAAAVCKHEDIERHLQNIPDRLQVWTNFKADLKQLASTAAPVGSDDGE